MVENKWNIMADMEQEILGDVIFELENNQIPKWKEFLDFFCEHSDYFKGMISKIILKNIEKIKKENIKNYNELIK